MPQRDVKDIDVSRVDHNNIREPGYEWMKDRFGPPPGIPRKEKERLDNLSDRDYVGEVLKMSRDEIESLMVSEAERRRTFRPIWTYNNLVSGAELAKAGFYCLNAGDCVKCTFCCGIIKQWNKGDSAMGRHKRLFGCCKFIQGRANDNIPFDQIGLEDFLAVSTSQSRDSLTSAASGSDSSVKASHPDELHPGLNINLNTNASSPVYVHHHKRVESFQVATWAEDLKCLIEKIADAGFYYSGSKDKCVCFFCNGSLEGWEPDDNPWVEHSKWYYKCPFLIQSMMTGGDFIRKVRSQMTDEDRTHADRLKYNTGNINPDSKEVRQEVIAERRDQKIKQCNIYKYAEDMLLDMELVKTVYKSNNYDEFRSSVEFMQLYHKLEDGEALDKKRTNNEAMDIDIDEPKEVDSHPEMSLDLRSIVQLGEVRDPEEGKLLVKRLTCQLCKANMCGAVCLPCGCFALCHDCCRKDKPLPVSCPRCRKKVRGACRAFFAGLDMASTVRAAGLGEVVRA